MRKRLWIDAPLQLRILLFIFVLLSTALVLAYLSVSRGLEDSLLRSGRAYVPITWIQDALRFPFFLASAIALIAGSFIAFIWAHRLIGPLMVLTAALKRVGQGDLRNGLGLRDTDVRWHTTEEFERLREALRRQVSQDRKLLSKVDSRLEALSSQIKSTPAAQELRSIQEELGKVTSSFQL